MFRGPDQNFTSRLVEEVSTFARTYSRAILEAEYVPHIRKPQNKGKRPPRLEPLSVNEAFKRP